VGSRVRCLKRAFEFPILARNAFEAATKLKASDAMEQLDIDAAEAELE